MYSFSFSLSVAYWLFSRLTFGTAPTIRTRLQLGLCPVTYWPAPAPPPPPWCPCPWWWWWWTPPPPCACEHPPTESLNSAGGGSTAAAPPSPSSESASIGGGNVASVTACRCWMFCAAAAFARWAAIVAACFRVNELCRWKPVAGGLGLWSPSSSSLRTSGSWTGTFAGVIITAIFFCSSRAIGLGTSLHVTVTSWSLLTPEELLSPASSWRSRSAFSCCCCCCCWAFCCRRKSLG